MTNAIVIHFGSSFKGSQQFPQYFIPLSGPGLVQNSTLLQRLQTWITFKRFIKNATSVFATHTWTENYLQSHLPKNRDTLQNAFLPISGLPQLEWVSISAAKQELTHGADYFLAFMTVDHFVHTLKEFSIFKKWQQTSMAILFVCKDQKELDKAEALVKGYKYRNAVFFKLAETIDLIDFAAAYCTVWSSATNYYTRFMQWSAGLGVPLLINSKTNYAIAYTKAGESFDFTETMGLSNHFKLYYKDEVYKQSKANHGHAWFNQMTTEGSTKNASLLDRCLP